MSEFLASHRMNEWPPDVVVEALAHQRRRYILLCLNEEPLALADLAKEVAARETDISIDPSTDAVEHVYISLYHHHVPKLADAGLVQYDRGTMMVELTDHERRVGQSFALLVPERASEQ